MKSQEDREVTGPATTPRTPCLALTLEPEDKEDTGPAAAPGTPCLVLALDQESTGEDMEGAQIAAVPFHKTESSDASALCPGGTV